MHLIFFLALILIIVFARGSSSASVNAAKRAGKQAFEDRRTWISSLNLDPQEAGYDVKSYVDNPDNKEAILAEVKECYDSIFEKKPFRQICPPQTWSNPNQHEHIAERSFRLNKRRAACILCAKRGYAYSVGYSAFLGCYSELDKQTVLWCRDELRKQGKQISVITDKRYRDLSWEPQCWRSCAWLQFKIAERKDGLIELE